MSKMFIEFTDGTTIEEYMWEGGFRIKDGLLIIEKGRYESPLFINMQVVKSFTRKD